MSAQRNRKEHTGRSSVTPAIDAPRLNALPTLVRLEPAFSAEVVAAMQAAGHEVVATDHRDAYFGGVSAISPFGGGSDPRRSGYVIML